MSVKLSAFQRRHLGKQKTISVVCRRPEITKNKIDSFHFVLGDLLTLCVSLRVNPEVKGLDAPSLIINARGQPWATLPKGSDLIYLGAQATLSGVMKMMKTESIITRTFFAFMGPDHKIWVENTLFTLVTGVFKQAVQLPTEI